MKAPKTLAVLFMLLLVSITSATADYITWKYLGLTKVKSAAFTTDGKFLAAFDATTSRIAVFDPAARKAVTYIYDKDFNKIYQIKFSPGSYILNAIILDKSDGLVLKRWDISTNTELPILKIQADTTDTFSDFLISGKYLIGITDNDVIQIFSASDGSRLRDYYNGEDFILPSAFAVSNNDSLFAATTSDYIFLLDLKTGEKIRQIPSSHSNSYMISFSRDGSRIFAWRDSVYVYDINSAASVDSFKLPAGTQVLTFSPDDKYVISAGAYDMTVTDFNTKSKIKDTQFDYKTYLSSVSFCQATNTIALAADNVYLFSFDTLDSLSRLPVQSFVNTYVAYSGDNQNLFINTKGNYSIINRQNGEITRQFKGQVPGIAVLPVFNQYYYVKDNSKIVIADVFTGNEVESYDAGRNLQSLVISPDKKFVIAIANPDSSYMINWANKEKLYDLDSLNFAFFSPNGKYVITQEILGKNYLKIRKSQTGEVVFSDNWFNINKAAISPDEKLLALYSKELKIMLYNLETRLFEKEINDDSLLISPGITKMNIARDNRHLIFSRNNGSIIILNIETGYMEYYFDYLEEKFTWFDLSADEKYIAASYQDGSLIQYEVPNGIVSVDEENEMQSPLQGIFPNPAIDMINIRGETSNQNAAIEIFDHSGNLIATAKDKTSIDVSALPNGVYYVRIKGKVQKIVKVK